MKMVSAWYKSEKVIHLKMLDDRGDLKDKMILSLEEAKESVRVLQVAIERLES